ncbi:MAG: hypothetical protein IT559_04515, partial [Alphaproteobacteria bacterium]|nr:hypothetical protein [Alphaproteobacteria bacterium]
MNKTLPIFLGGFALLLIVASQAFYIVDQRQQAIVLQLGQPQGEPRGPGLHIKIPMIQNVVYFDRRILSIDPPPDQMVISSSLVERIKFGAPKSAEEEAMDEAAKLAEPETAPETLEIS